jgi:hypothetical protein
VNEACNEARTILGKAFDSFSAATQRKDYDAIRSQLVQLTSSASDYVRVLRTHQADEWRSNVEEHSIALRAALVEAETVAEELAKKVVDFAATNSTEIFRSSFDEDTSDGCDDPMCALDDALVDFGNYSVELEAANTSSFQKPSTTVLDDADALMDGIMHQAYAAYKRTLAVLRIDAEVARIKVDALKRILALVNVPFSQWNCSGTMQTPSLDAAVSNQWRSTICNITGL